MDVTIFYYKIFISKHFPSTITDIYQQTPSAVALSYVYMSKSWCIESDANKVSLMLKTEMADSYFVVLEKFGGYLKIKLRLKTISCWLSQISVKYLGIKIYANIVLERSC